MRGYDAEDAYSRPAPETFCPPMRPAITRLGVPRIRADRLFFGDQRHGRSRL
jgi:hypothetical protein